MEADELSWDVSAEQSVIGSMLIDDKTVGLVVSELSEDDFQLEACRVLFRAFRALYLQDAVMDPVSVLAAAGRESDESMRRYPIDVWRKVGRGLAKLGYPEEAAHGQAD